MKKQFSTLVMWQEDVVKVHQSHKEKFEETKKLISSVSSHNLLNYIIVTYINIFIDVSFERKTSN